VVDVLLDSAAMGVNTIKRDLLYDIALYCLNVGGDGHRGDIIILKTAKTLAAFHGRDRVIKEDIVVDVAQPRRKKQAEAGRMGTVP
jgi:magnesium chelatase subunit I